MQTTRSTQYFLTDLPQSMKASERVAFDLLWSFPRKRESITVFVPTIIIPVSFAPDNANGGLYGFLCRLIGFAACPYHPHTLVRLPLWRRTIIRSIKRCSVISKPHACICLSSCCFNSQLGGSEATISRRLHPACSKVRLDIQSQSKRTTIRGRERRTEKFSSPNL